MADWNQYAASREHLNYYRVVREAINRHSPGETILDVGCGGTSLVGVGDFKERLAINTEPVSGYPWTLIVGEWPNVTLPREKFDVVLCCQVLEHLTDEQIPPFVAKLKSVSDVLIVSVPFKWKRGTCKHHLQDPIDDAKLASWIGKPEETVIIKDGRLSRIVATYLA